MTLLDYFIQQCDFVKWADDRCLTAAASVPDETYHKDFGFSFGSVHNVLVHMMGAQYMWLNRLKDPTAEPTFPQPPDVPTMQVLRQRWDALHEEWRLYVRSLTEAQLLDRIHYVRRGQHYSGILWTLLNHTFDHATHHRGQLNSLIKLAGGTPGDYGYIILARLEDGQSV